MNFSVREHDAQTVTVEKAYSSMFSNYPDVMNVDQVSEILMISNKTCYALIRGGEIRALKVGRSFRIPKLCLFDYLKVAEA